MKIINKDFDNEKEIIELLPIKTILPFAKHLINYLPAGWVICNGDVINDDESDLNGLNTPDLRNYEILRGNNNSGVSGGSNTHNHGGVTSTYGGYGSSTQWDGFPRNHNHSISTHDNTLKGMEIVYIMKVK